MGRSLLFAGADKRSRMVQWEVRQGSWISGDGAGEYRTEVPQQSRNGMDSGARAGTVTCADRRGWTCCLLLGANGCAARMTWSVASWPRCGGYVLRGLGAVEPPATQQDAIIVYLPLRHRADSSSAALSAAISGAP
jgi:hypothetical protein